MALLVESSQRHRRGEHGRIRVLSSRRIGPRFAIVHYEFTQVRGLLGNLECRQDRLPSDQIRGPFRNSALPVGMGSEPSEIGFVGEGFIPLRRLIVFMDKIADFSNQPLGIEKILELLVFVRVG